jgi:EmrB/QacA subfamily drug resistance transporter
MRSKIGLGVVLLGTALGPMDTAVNVAFPYITSAFGKPLDAIQWVVICYVLTYASLMLVCGKLGDLFGYRLIFVLGLIVSAIGLGACALATQYETLLLARFGQGIGTALVLSCSAALALAQFPEDQRTRILGIYTMAFGIGSATGPIAAGIMIQQWGWTTVFWFRVPVCLVALSLSFILPRSVRQQAKGGFDILGAALITLALTTAILSLNRAQENETGSAAALLAITAVVSFLLFILRENRAAEPIIRPALFRDLAFAVVNLASAVIHLVGFSVLLLVPYYLRIASPYEAQAAGFILAINLIGYVLGSACSPPMIRRIFPNRVCLLGLVITAAGLFLVAFWEAQMHWLWLTPSLLLIGFGQGLFQVSFIDTVMARLPVSEHGVAGSLGILTRTIGVVFGVTALTLVFERFRVTEAEGIAGFMAAFGNTFSLAAAVTLVFVVLTLARPRIWLGRSV